MASWTRGALVAALLLGVCLCDPLRHETQLPVTELGKSLAGVGAGHGVAPRMQEPRLPLPTPQELEAIKKVAQILIMLGEQVIPSIIGDEPSGGCCAGAAGVAAGVDSPYDSVEP